MKKGKKINFYNYLANFGNFVFFLEIEISAIFIFRDFENSAKLCHPRNFNFTVL